MTQLQDRIQSTQKEIVDLQMKLDKLKINLDHNIKLLQESSNGTK